MDDPDSSTPREGLSRFATGTITGCLLVVCYVVIQHVKNLRTGTCSRITTSGYPHNLKTNKEAPTIRKPLIPFVYVASSDSKGIDRVIQSSLAQFRNEASLAVQGMSRALETALDLELELQSATGSSTSSPSISKAALLSTKLQNRIQAMATCLEADEKLLETVLLAGFQPTLALPDDSQSSETKNFTRPTWNNREKTSHASNQLPFIRPGVQSKRQRQNCSDDNAYDAAGQIVAHLVRDWTRLGFEVRRSLYDWCLEQLLLYGRHGGPVLVPGAGMGRLAYSLYQHGYTVEANELSPVMAAAAQAILQREACGVVHPFLLDRLSNEVDSRRRFDPVPFPDIPIQRAPQHHEGASLSFTIGDFSHYLNRQNKYEAIVTCFFLDTATNIYEYLLLIRRILKPGGAWINVGPLQWHRNAMTFPTADELRELIVAFGFQIVVWKVDETPVAYRDQNVDGGAAAAATFVRTTNLEAYRPLRFVAIQK